MLAKERRAIIMDILIRDKIVKINDISKHFSVSNETARRDLEALQDTHHVKRIYGGAVLTDPSPSLPDVHRTELSYQRHKHKVSIGKTAAQMVGAGETIILDIGTTTLEIARHLRNIHGITVLTSSLPILNELADSSVNVFCLGGRLNSDELSMYGKITTNALQQFFVDKAFIGAGGITLDGGISDYNTEEASVRQEIIKRTSQTILVADSDKFGTNAFATVCNFDAIDIIVSDANLPASFRKGLEKLNNLKLILAPNIDDDILDTDNMDV